MSTRTNIEAAGRRRVALLVLAGALGVGVAAAAAGVRVEPDEPRMARVATAPDADATQRGDGAQAPSAGGGACPSGTAAVAKRAVLGKGNGRYCITVGRNLTGSTHVDPLYSRVSSSVIGFYRGRADDQGSTASTVVCWSREDWLDIGGKGLLGFVWPGTGVVNLAPQVCARLDRIVYHGARAETYRLAEAVDTLAHESIHVAGVMNEARTECYAMQLTQYTGERLGTSAEYGYELGSILLEDYPSWKGTKYYTPACHDGSKLDLYPETGVFPRG